MNATKQVPVEPTEEMIDAALVYHSGSAWPTKLGIVSGYKRMLAAAPAAGGHYTEGICGDGAAILCDGRPITIAEVLRRLNAAPNHEAERLAVLPKITDELLEQFGDTDLIEIDVFGGADWTQTAVDFVCAIYSTRPEEGGSDV